MGSTSKTGKTASVVESVSTCSTLPVPIHSYGNPGVQFFHTLLNRDNKAMLTQLRTPFFNFQGQDSHSPRIGLRTLIRTQSEAALCNAVELTYRKSYPKSFAMAAYVGVQVGQSDFPRDDANLTL